MASAMGFANTFDAFSIIVVCFSALALGFFTLGYAVQSWEEQPGIETGGEADGTWGTWLTCYALFVECATMAIVAPGEGVVKYSIVIAFALDGLSWLCSGLLHSFFPTSSSAHDTIWVSAMLLSNLGSFAKAYAAHLAVREHGKCQCCPSSRVIGIAGGAIAALWIGLTLVLYESFILPDWVFVMVKQVLAMLALVVYGVNGGSARWSAAIFVSFGAAVVLDILKPEPFKYSTNFNDNGLFHSAMMLYTVSVFGLFQDIVDAMEVHSSNRFLRGLQEVKQHLQDRAKSVEEGWPLREDGAGACCTSAGAR